jgi:Kae1-associated kinase Bud32
MIIAQGAEAKLYREDGVLIKERVRKGYRIVEIDEKLRKRRTKQEAKLLREAKRIGVAVPSILEEQDFIIKMEFIDGEKIKDILNEDNAEELSEKIGKSIGLLHSYDIIHGDLTTSNMILKDEVYFIDFGLGFFSKKKEDKAVDLYLLHEALESTHFKVKEKAWKIILKSYQRTYLGSEEVIKTLSKIEKRRRYAHKG